MIKKRFVAFISAITIIFGTSCAFAQYEQSAEYDVFEQVAGYISTYYIDETLTDQTIMNNAVSEFLRGDDDRLVGILKSMLKALDPYSEFYTAEEYQQFVNNLNKTFYGIGVRIEVEGDYVVIVGFTSGSGAEAAGIKVGDKISKVNGENMFGKTTTHVRNAIAGELGAPVEITVIRDNVEHTFTVNRCQVNEDTVTYIKMSDTVAYISVIDMSDHTAQEFENALKQADADGIKNIILDLRNNGGGYLSCAIKMASMVVPKGVIVDTKYRQPFMDETYYSELANPKYTFNILVNGYTASASEIFASAIQDSGVGKLIGEQTFGKGYIQSSFPLSNGSVFKLTVGHYITRNGKEINGVGLTPDVKLVNEAVLIDASKYTPFTFTNKWHIGSTDSNVYAAKEKLYYLGYYEGVINDTFDAELESAICAFQEADDLYAYGVLDITTQSRIDKHFSKLEIVVDQQLMKAYEMFTGEKELPEAFR